MYNALVQIILSSGSSVLVTDDFIFNYEDPTRLPSEFGLSFYDDQNFVGITDVGECKLTTFLAIPFEHVKSVLENLK